MEVFSKLSPDPSALMQRRITLPSEFLINSEIIMNPGNFLVCDQAFTCDSILADYRAECEFPSIFIDAFGLLVATPMTAIKIAEASRNEIRMLDITTCNKCHLVLLLPPVIDCMDKIKSKIQEFRGIRSVTRLVVDESIIANDDLVRVKDWEVAVIASKQITETVRSIPDYAVIINKLPGA